MKALFYRADILHSASRYADAMADAMKAHQLAIRFNDPYWRAKSAEIIGFILSDSYVHADAARSFAEAAHFYNIAGRTANHRFSLIDYAIASNNSGLSDRAIEIADSIYSVSLKDRSYPALTEYSLRTLYHCYAFKNDTANMADALRLLSENTQSLEACDYSYMAKKAIDAGNTSLGAELIAKSDSLCKNPKDRILIYKNMSDYFRVSGHYSDALQYLDSVLVLQSRALSQAFRQSSVAVQRDSYLNQAIDQEEKANTLKTIVTLSSAVFLIIITSLIAFFRLRMRINKIETDSRISEMMALTHEHATMQSPIPDSSSLDNSASNHANIIDTQELTALYRNQWNLLNSLCNKYFENSNDPQARQTIIDHIERNISEMRQNLDLDSIERHVNCYTSGLIGSIRIECPFLKSDDISMLILILAGFAPKTVCFFMGIRLKNYYAKRTRLLARIAKSEAPHKEDFVTKIKEFM